MDDWFNVLESGNHISLSDNGWTDNKLGLDWLQTCFELATARYQKEEY